MVLAFPRRGSTALAASQSTVLPAIYPRRCEGNVTAFTRHVSHAAGSSDDSTNSWIPTAGGLVTAWLARGSLTSGLTYTAVSVRLSRSVSARSRATPNGRRKRPTGRQRDAARAGQMRFPRRQSRRSFPQNPRAQKGSEPPLRFSRGHARSGEALAASRARARERHSVRIFTLFERAKISRGVGSILAAKSRIDALSVDRRLRDRKLDLSLAATINALGNFFLPRNNSTRRKNKW